MVAEVLSAEAQRVAIFKEERVEQIKRQKLAGLLLEAKQADGCLLHRRKLAASTGGNLPVQPAEFCLPITPVNRSDESGQGINSKRLGDRVPDRPSSHTEFDASIYGPQWPLIFGNGDSELGALRISAVGIGRLEFVIEAFEDGVGDDALNRAIAGADALIEQARGRHDQARR